jgi:hypothetical protein
MMPSLIFLRLLPKDWLPKDWEPVEVICFEKHGDGGGGGMELDWLPILSFRLM